MTVKPAEKPTIAKSILSPRELEVALYRRINLGRNAIAAVLNLSPNSIKTILRRINDKLGSNWLYNPNIIWPQTETSVKDKLYAIEEDNDDPENGLYSHLRKEIKERMRGRAISFRLLVEKNKKGQDVLNIGASQRLWLRPALIELEKQKYIKLISVDWNETFAPPWLPVVYHGRRAIRAAIYGTYHYDEVMTYIKFYLENDLQQYLMEIYHQLCKVQLNSKKNCQYIPNFSQLMALVATDLNIQGKTGVTNDSTV
ncbi:helix-turn-helix transcriptional regulator [Moorella sp. ACPs]|jgi:DNA-binding CsgD family transcriptional regulator|uniref:helix-turn-helix transcriptional regulator n=1 Tax=Neomoorella carbonis TaxID=3062783 RepID=UPI0032488583